MGSAFTTVIFLSWKSSVATNFVTLNPFCSSCFTLKYLYIHIHNNLPVLVLILKVVDNSYIKMQLLKQINTFPH